MSTKYSVEEVREAASDIRSHAPNKYSTEIQCSNMLNAYAERINADESAVPVAWMCDTVNGYKAFSTEPKFPCNVGYVTPLFTHPPAQTAQVDDKVVVINDGKPTTEGLVLAAAIYMGAVKDIFALRPDGPPYNERKVTKDTSALRAFDHLDAATKALRSVISHFTPTAEPVAQDEADELLPCPFCQSPKDRHGAVLCYSSELGSSIEWQYVQCLLCDARGPKFTDQAKAVIAWNRRIAAQSRAVPDDDLAAKIDAHLQGAGDEA